MSIDAYVIIEQKQVIDVMCRYSYILCLPAKNRYSLPQRKEVGLYECDLEDYKQLITKLKKDKTFERSFVELENGKIYTCHWEGAYTSRKLIWQKIADVNDYQGLLCLRRMEARTSAFITKLAGHDRFEKK